MIKLVRLLKYRKLIKSHPEYKNIPVIYFSANNDVATLAQEAGADTYLAKPFDLDQLEDLLSNVLQQ